MEALAIVGPIVQGVGGFVANRKNAANLEAQATEEVNAGENQAMRVRAQARHAIGGQIAAQFSNGFEGGTGSALDWLAESQVQATLDMLELRRQAGSKARSLKSQASQARTQGWFDLVGGLVGAGATAHQQQIDKQRVESNWAAPRMPG
ncbi:hypothetical protein [Novosphingobium sp.]|uniref:hypothetical protein n=1 Tax=Novosphingobium sp. TaxID=1874826 RepID=UPI00286DA64C|nr:hypothetical protein [Novosphingobium sp.]